MTINKIITDVDILKPSAYTPEQKAGWIVKVDGMVNRDIVKSLTYTAPEYPTDGEAELLAPAPYDDMYMLFVEAQIARYQQDYEDYNNTILLFNDAFANYAKYWLRNNVPAEPKWASSAISITADVFTIANHPLHDGDRVVFRGAVPGGLWDGCEYFVINTSGSAFQISASKYGAAIALTDGGTYTMEKAAARVRNIW